MDKEKLLEIKRDLASIPILEKKLKNLEEWIVEASGKAKEFEKEYKKKAYDIELLNKNSISSVALKLIGMYQGKLNKETNEMLIIKLKYDKATIRVKELEKQKKETLNRLEIINNEKEIYEKELAKREFFIKNKITEESFINYKELSNQYEINSNKLEDVNDAISIAARIEHLEKDIIDILKHMDCGMTYDACVKKDNHECKYDNLDRAQEHVNVLYSKIKDLEKVLKDLDEPDILENLKTDYLNKCMEQWLNDIETELDVRDRIMEYINSMKKMTGNINEITFKLKRKRDSINAKLKDIVEKKEELMVSI